MKEGCFPLETLTEAIYLVNYWGVDLKKKWLSHPSDDSLTPNTKCFDSTEQTQEEACSEVCQLETESVFHFLIRTKFSQTNGTKMSSGIFLAGSGKSWWFSPSSQSTWLPTQNYCVLGYILPNTSNKPCLEYINLKSQINPSIACICHPPRLVPAEGGKSQLKGNTWIEGIEHSSGKMSTTKF